MDKMRLPKGVLAVLLVSSFVFPFLLVSGHGNFPYLGLSLSFATIAYLGFFAKEKRTRFEALAFGAVLVLCVFLELRANIFLSLLNILAILFLGSYFLSLPRGVRSLFSLVYIPVATLAQIFQLPSPLKIPKFSPASNSKLPERIGEHLPAIAITVIVLVIVIPLLSYANPFFQKLVTDSFKALDLTWLLQHFRERPIVYIARFVVFLFFIAFFPRVSIFWSERTKDTDLLKSFRINLLIPKLVLSLVLIVFFITQLQLYFSSPETLKALGYTNSQYAREVFGQLSVVAFIIFLLIYGDRTQTRQNKFLTTLLIVEGVFLSCIALKSDVDYVGQYGFTHMRLYGYAGVTWIFGLFALFSYHYYKSQFEEVFVRHIVSFTTLVLIGINIVNFDYLIYHRAKPTVFGVDHAYLSRLSPDAKSYDVHLQMLLQLLKTETNSEKQLAYIAAAFRIIERIEYLQNKYTQGFPATFNLSEYQMYEKVKNVNVREVREYLSNKQIPAIQAQTGLTTEIPVEEHITSIPAQPR